jgi:hypothetical protein
MLLAGVGTLLLVGLSLRTMDAIAPFQGAEGHARAAWIMGSLAVAMGTSLFLWKRAKEYVFAATIGTVMSFILIAFARMLLGGGSHDPFFMTLSIIAVALVWRFLFGPWGANVKATMLGMFILWVAYHTLFQEAPQELTAHLIAIPLAAIPAIVWCALFLPYHKEKLSVVFLMFFSGMLSTAPILFYDALVRQRVEMQFFVFKIVPESFNASVQAFLRTTTVGASPLQVTILSLFINFLFVGLLEEGSKYWVLRKNGSRYMTSIDDTIQLAIVVAIGFAFAENITNTGYFLSFVQEYLLTGQGADWKNFLANVGGRSILTSMVHIVSTGILGYFLGLTLFADPCLKEAEKAGKKFWVAEGVRWMFGLPKESAFRTEMLTSGVIIAMLLHAFSNFLVTLPEVLPGNPRTLGDLLQSSPGSPFHFVALLLFPSLLYVVGGFWLLTSLVLHEENSKERGHIAAPEAFVSVS